MSSPIRICYLSSVLMNDHSGTERHLLRLMGALDRRQFSPELLVLQPSSFIDRWDNPEISIQALGLTRPLSLRYWQGIRQLARKFRKEDVQIVECHSPEAQFVGGLAAHWGSVPVLVAARRNSGYSYNFTSRLRHAWTQKWVDCYLANSQTVIDTLSHREGIAKERFRRIYNGVDVDRFDREGQLPVDPSFVAACQSNRMVALVANLRPVKNIPLFLYAAQQVLRSFKEVRFALFGAGPDEQPLRQLTHELGIAEQTLFMGPQVPVAPYLRHCAMGCLTSNSEGFSNSILEYMTMSLPVIATDVGGAGEAIVEGVTGFVVPPQQVDALSAAILRLLRDPDAARKLGQAGRRRVEDDFSLSRQMEQYTDFYRALIDKKKAATENK